MQYMYQSIGNANISNAHTGRKWEQLALTGKISRG